MQLQPVKENAPTILPNDQGARISNQPADYNATSAIVKPNPATFHTTVPAELLALPNWILWKLERISGKPKPNKTPYQTTGELAATNNPAHRFRFNDELGVVDAALRLDYSGLGFVLTSELPYTGVDLDKSVNADGSVKPWAQAIVDRLDSYTERTPSGDGLRVWVNAKLGDLVGHKFHYQDGAVEFYDSGRYFTVTGAHFSGTPSTIEPRAAALGTIHDAVRLGKSLGITPPDPKKESPKILRAMSADLSDYNGDRSSAVAGVLLWMASKFEGNRDKMEQAFEATELCRLWSDKWPRLKDSELDGAIKKWQKDQPAKKAVVDPSNWRDIFHSYDDAVNAPPLTFAIDGFLQEEGVTMLGGLSGHGKTLAALAMTRALLEAKPLFDHFKVPKASPRVVYLIPECGLSSFVHRLKTFRLLDFVKDGRLVFRTLSAKEDVEITDPRILRACEGADVFLDTAVRFMEGDENTATDSKKFAETLFSLTKVGARTVTGLHHSAKEFDRARSMTLENVLRGSGDIGAMLSTCWGIYQVDRERTRLFIQNVKPRDFEPCQPFVVEGRPQLDRDGYFKLLKRPGQADDLQSHKQTGKKGGKTKYIKEKPEKLAQANLLIEEGYSVRMAAKAVNVDEKTLRNWRTATGHLDDDAEAVSAERPQ